MTTMAQVAVDSENRVRLLLVRMVMSRIRCQLVLDHTGLVTCARHGGSTEDWAVVPDPVTLVCLHAVTQAGLTGGE